MVRQECLCCTVHAAHRFSRERRCVELPRCVVVALDQLQIVLACPGALESESCSSGPTCNVMFPYVSQIDAIQGIQDNTRHHENIGNPVDS